MKKHGLSKTRAYKSWTSMIYRCTKKNKDGYHRYGGRGITICDRWMDFLNFYEDMGDRRSGDSLDRIDNDGNYEKDNCRWATKKQQSNNTSSNRALVFNGVSRNIIQWERILGFKNGVINDRLRRNWTVDRIITTPYLRQKGAVNGKNI